MPTPRFYQKTRHLNIADFIQNFVAWLVNDHPTKTGPGWEIVEAYGQNGGGTSFVEGVTPGTRAFNQGSLSNFANIVSWDVGGPSVIPGNWIVLRSRTYRGSDSFGRIECEVYIECQSTTEMQIRVIPLNDFATGGGVVTPPTFPATTFGSGTGAVSLVKNAAFDGYVVGDEGMFSMVLDDGLDPRWTYIGEVDAQNVNDQRPYVAWDVTTNLYFAFFDDDRWTRLSPVDNSTILTVSDTVMWRYSSSTAGSMCNGGFGNRPDTQVHPAGVFFETTDSHFMGTLRNVYLGNQNMPYKGALKNGEYIFFNELDSSSDTYCGVVFRWDGSAI
jgi:hypothetical protein